MAYPGGKSGAGVYQTIINLMPPHPVYIEPFLGGGAIMRLKRPAALNIGVDLDGAVIRQWQASIAENGEAAAAIAKDSEARSTFRFQRGDGIAFLAAYPFTGAEMVYCDPPYMHETRGRRDLYRYEMSDRQHAELLDVVKALPCRVIISGYWTRRYAKALKQWNTASFQAITRGGRLATEWLWFNFPEPVALHDYRYLGEDFRERERIKRKKQRWVNRLQKMPTLERRALLCAIAEAWQMAPAETAMEDSREYTRGTTAGVIATNGDRPRSSLNMTMAAGQPAAAAVLASFDDDGFLQHRHSRRYQAPPN
jgi:DNA adenine methylase